MKNAADFLDALRVKHNLTSDYQLAKFLGMKTQQLSRYRGGSSTFDDTTSAKIAESLGIDPGFVAACMSAQRARTDDARRMWEKVAKKVAAGAAIAFALALAYAVAPDSLIQGAEASQFVNTQYYVKYYTEWIGN